MLSKLPKHPGDLSDLLPELGNPSARQLARALGVSPRTVQRWKHHGAPRMALLSLWWLSQEGHSAWDAEMHNRTVNALGLKDALWREIASLRRMKSLDGAVTSGMVGRSRRASNEPQPATAQVLTGPKGGPVPLPAGVRWRRSWA